MLLAVDREPTVVPGQVQNDRQAMQKPATKGMRSTEKKLPARRGEGKRRTSARYGSYGKDAA
jgi:hypothetical protein